MRGESARGGHFRSERNGVFIIAEIGGNHEGDFQYAKALTRLAVDSGADAVKFQIYEGNRLVSRVADAARNAHFKRFELTRQEYTYLADMCRDAGVQFMASVWDTENLAWADPLIQIHKIGSGDFTAYPILQRLVGTGKPLILSTGLCTMEEIAETLTYVAKCDSRYIPEGRLALLQCTTSYPCPPEDANLDVISALRKAFGVPVGYSDHTVGMTAAIGSVALGAEILEKHFTDSREGKTFRDHAIAGTRDEFRRLAAEARLMRRLRGTGVKQPTPAEIGAGHVTSFRRSVYAAAPIRAGETFTAGNLTILRPETGIPARKFDRLIGRRAARDLAVHEALQYVDIMDSESPDLE